MKFLRTIAKDEGVAETTLDRYYKKYGNIDKAVYMAKIQRSRNQKVTIRNTELSLSDLSIVLGIPITTISSFNSAKNLFNLFAVSIESFPPLTKI